MKLLLPLLTAAVSAFAQSPAIPINIGYAEPAPFQAAPGQVVTLFLDDVPFGSDGRTRSAQAAAGDLPTSLAGITVRIELLDSTMLQAGIFAVEQQLQCGLSGLQAGDAACLLTLVKIQVPFELPGDLVLNNQNVYTVPRPALISIDVDGKRGRGFPLQPLPDNAHVLTNCDAVWDTNGSSVCDRQVYHADGSMVTPAAPAKSGETLFLLSYGLGRTDPMVPTGHASPEGVALSDLLPNHPRVTLGIAMNFVNALSSAPRTGFNSQADNAIPVPITSASLVAGQVGTYKVSFSVPAPTDSIIPCGGDVKSNSLLLVTTSQGVEGIGLCLQQ
ncbi:MAG TPA: hypothetical protein VMH81_34515 [Bryobacteraceae bacterium]|nr:hypothetical protein [Bryobacteraceae bacterium]